MMIFFFKNPRIRQYTISISLFSDAPVFINAPYNQTVYHNRLALLNWTVDALPGASVTWLIGDVMINDNAGNDIVISP